MCESIACVLFSSTAGLTETLLVGWRAMGTVEPGCSGRRQGVWMLRAVTAEVAAVLLELMGQEREH